MWWFLCILICRLRWGCCWLHIQNLDDHPLEKKRGREALHFSYSSSVTTITESLSYLNTITITKVKQKKMSSCYVLASFKIFEWKIMHELLCVTKRSKKERSIDIREKGLYVKYLKIILVVICN